MTSEPRAVGTDLASESRPPTLHRSFAVQAPSRVSCQMSSAVPGELGGMTARAA